MSPPAPASPEQRAAPRLGRLQRLVRWRAARSQALAWMAWYRRSAFNGSSSECSSSTGPRPLRCAYQMNRTLLQIAIKRSTLISRRAKVASTAADAA
ncbi:MAG: hypothetical protein JSS14_30400 [Proteobacteria bacterium]|nr:hypothetical protein [Pseudomonadota bacterium]